MKQDVVIENFLKEKHGELSIFLAENMAFEQSRNEAKIYSYKLGQYDMITELCHKVRLDIDYEK